MFPLFDDGLSVSEGVCPYQYRPATQSETTPRIVVAVEVDEVRTEAVLDTGGIYLLCDPQFAQLLQLDPNEALQTCTVSGARVGARRKGSLHRVTLALLAQEGYTVYVEATAFVPEVRPGEELCFPVIMGMAFCLEGMRFAVDPATSNFHFADLEGAR